MKKLETLALLLTVISMHCHAADCDDLSSLNWLLGKWQTTTKTAVITESWKKVSALSFEGKGITQRGDKHSQETMRLVDMGGELFYLAKVSQNLLPIAFKLTECEAGKATFVNRDHDFPKQLVYSQADAGMRVDVSDGEGNGFTLSFTAVD